MAKRDAGDRITKQVLDARGNVVQNVFQQIGHQVITIDTAIGHVIGTRIPAGMNFVELTATVPCHVGVAASAVGKVLFSSTMTTDYPYLPAGVPKIISLGDNNVIGVRAAANQVAGTLHITLLQ